MKHKLLLGIGVIVVAGFAWAGWFFQSQRVALTFMREHPGLLRDKFRKSDDGVRIERVLELYEDQPNVLAEVRAHEAYAHAATSLGNQILKRVNGDSGITVKLCTPSEVAGCTRPGDLLTDVLWMYSLDEIQNMNDTLFSYLYDSAGNFHPWYENVDKLLVERQNETNLKRKYHLTFLISLFELFADDSVRYDDEIESLLWVWKEREVREVIRADLFMFNPHYIRSPEAKSAVFDDADAYRAALLLRDTYPMLTTFLYP